MKYLFYRIQNRLIRSKLISFIPSDDKTIYLTFDDGPEPDICEFVLDELKDNRFTATFFCRGDNAEKYPELFNRIVREGHAIGNHTYSHIDSFDNAVTAFVENVAHADEVLKTNLFRPPHGCLTFASFFKLAKKYKCFFWSLNSGDSDMEGYDYSRSINMLKTQTKPGDIVLFHFCRRHEKETYELLPAYLTWLKDNGFHSKAIKF